MDDLTLRATIRDELSGPLKGIRSELRGVGTEADRAGRHANLGARGFDRLAGGVGRFVRSGLATAARIGVTALGVLSAAAVAGSVKLVGLASDAAETASAFKTVFKGVGGDVPKYLKKINREFGVTTQELQEASLGFGVFGKAAGIPKAELGKFTKDLVGASLDLSSFYNRDPAEVFEALKSGLTGEIETVRQFGIFISEANMASQGKAMGFDPKAMTDQQMILVRQALIMKQLGDADGDLARTKDSLANKTKALKGRLTEMATVVGERLIPYVSVAAEHMDDWLKGAMRRLPKQLDVAETAIKGLVRRGRGLYDTFKADGLSGAIADLDYMTQSGGKLEDAFELVDGIVTDVSDIFTNSFVPAMSSAEGGVSVLLSPLGLARAALEFMADNADLTTLAIQALGAYLVISKAFLIGYTLVVKGIAVASTVWTAAQWLLNAALTANPIGLVVLAIAGLVAGIIIAWKKSDKFRAVVKMLWNDVLKPFGKWVLDKLVGAFLKIGSTVLKIGYYATVGFGFLVDAAFFAFDKVLAAAEKGMGWIPGLGGKIKNARKGFDEMGDDIGAKLDQIGQDALAAAGKLDEMAKDRKSVITIETRNVSTAVRIDRADRIGGVGDTATSKGRGGSFANTLWQHQRASMLSGSRLSVTNAFVGGGGRGRGSGDHQAGRALDLQGPGMGAYASTMRAMGGYAAFHGSGADRHLHAVPPASGDTSSTRARSAASRSPSGGGGGGAVVIEAGAIQVQVVNPAADVDVKRATKEAIEEWMRDRGERS